MSVSSMSHVALTEKSAPLVEKAKTAKDAMSEKWKVGTVLKCVSNPYIYLYVSTLIYICACM